MIGTWLSTKDGGLFGGGGRGEEDLGVFIAVAGPVIPFAPVWPAGGTMRPKKGKSGRGCQTRLSSAYNVAKAKDRKRERRRL